MIDLRNYFLKYIDLTKTFENIDSGAPHCKIHGIFGIFSEKIKFRRIFYRSRIFYMPRKIFSESKNDRSSKIFFEVYGFDQNF